ncbi:MAG: hypothetical protein ACI9N9_000084 [Enterobacterales bacterium]|jgi:hypothetical protein
MEGYTDNPRLENENDIYYEGCGTTWDVDLDGKRYWKLYHPVLSKFSDDDNSLSHLSTSSIVNEEARITKIVVGILKSNNLIKV